MKFFAFLGSVCFCLHVIAMTPEIDLGPDEPVKPSLIEIERVRHDVHVSDDALSIRTEWSFHEIDHPAPTELLFGSVYKSKKITAVQIDGKSSKFIMEPTGILRVPILRWPNAIEIQYELLEAKIDTILEITSHEFFILLPYVASSHGYGFDTRPIAALNFSDSILTTATVWSAKDFIVYGSSQAIDRGTSTEIAPRAVARFVLGFANPRTHTQRQFRSEDTDFLVISPIGIAGFDPAVFQQIIQRSWPMFLARFPSPSNWIVLHDDQSLPVGAGPTGSNVFGFGYMESVPAEIQQMLLDQAGWPKLKNTEEYISHLIPSSPDPARDYWTTIINHELGHLFFGFGLTFERHLLQHEYWMSLGLGLAVDERITEKMTTRSPEFYDGLVSFWQTKLARLPIDQRLENPSLSADASYQVSSFNRLQHFAHGKSLHFWRQVRAALGEAKFDSLANDFVRAGGYSKGYSEFRPILLQVLPTLPEIEQRLQIL